MSRPKISPTLLAQLVGQAPGRVRKRLDSDPGVANQWDWSCQEKEWSIRTQDETVHLSTSDGVGEIVSSLSDVGCSCLLSPKCFHILACCSVLEIHTHASDDVEDSFKEIAADEGDAMGLASDTSAATRRGAAVEIARIEVSEGIRAAARSATSLLEQLLRIGARYSGVLLQTELLRAAHQCRATEFVTLSHALIGIVEGIRRIRSQSDEADAATLRDDVVQALWFALGASSVHSIPRWMIGQTRRGYAPVELRKVQGVLAEPVLTRSGYAGVSVLLHDVHGGGLYSIHEVRSGDANRIHQAYLGGIDLGGMTVEAKALCRGTYSVQGLMASEEGRLGKGKDAKWGRTKPHAEKDRSVGRFRLSTSEQIAAMQAWLDVADDVRPVGWNVLEVTGIVVGANGDSLIVELVEDAGVWRFQMPMDAPQLEYRHNFQLLARCAGMRLHWYVRMRFDAAQTADAIAIRKSAEENASDEADTVRLDFPESWNSICNLGLDRLERYWMHGIQNHVNEYGGQEFTNSREDVSKFVQSIERRLVGIGLGGSESMPGLGSRTLHRDCEGLKKLGLAYGAMLLEQLSTHIHAREDSTSTRHPEGRMGERENSFGIASAYLACAKYIEGFKVSMAIDPHLDRAADQLRSPIDRKESSANG